MDIQCHHQTKVSLINLKVQVPKNYTGCVCKKSRTLMCIVIIILLLVERMSNNVNSFSIVFKMANHITIYTYDIEQHN